MKSKVGFYVRENTVDILSASLGEIIAITGCSSFDLKINNFFENQTLEDEKTLLTTSELIRKSLLSAKLTESEANLVLPDERCSLQIIKLPLVSEKEIISAIELQSEEFVPYPIEKASFDYQILSVDREGGQMYLLLIVTLKDIIDKASDFVLDLGLYPVNVEPESTALYRLLLNQHLKTAESILMLINIGVLATQISILNLQQQQLITTNSINIGSQFFYKAIQNNLNVPMNSAIDLFTKIPRTDLNYQKVIVPVFAEFAKEVRKILMLTLEKLGTIPQNVYLYSPNAINTFCNLFKDNALLQQYNIVGLSSMALNGNKIKADPVLQAKLGQYLIPLGAII